MPDRFAAFISYAHRYKPWVRALQENLEKCLAAAGRQGKVWLDETDLGSGRSWVTQIQQGIDQSEHFILVATPEAFASERVADEWGSFITLRRAWLAHGRFHLALLVDVPLPPFLSSIQQVDFREAGEAGYRVGLQELTAGILGHSNSRSLPAPSVDLKIPSPPDSGLDPKLRFRLIEWLEPVLRSRLCRKAIAPELQLRADQLESHPSWACAASALVVLATGDDEPFAAAIRIVDTLRETLEEDEPARVTSLAPLREELVAKQQGSPERSLLAIWMGQVVADHERLVPYFQQQAETGLLDRVYVELEVQAGEGRATIAETALDADAPRPARPLGLREVLSLPREGNPWISGRWVVLGDPGAGKTTLLRHLAADLARQADRPWVPLFESLPKLVREREWLLDRVVRRLELAGHPAQGLAAVLDREAKEGRLLLLLDGLDEVSKEEKEDAEKLLRDLSVRWPATPIVVASRPIGYRPPGGDYRELRLLPLDRDRRKTFLARWLGRVAGKADEGRVEAALTALETPELRDLAGNPLYLTLMALLSEKGPEPAKRRTDLYDQVFTFLLAGKHHWPDERPMEAQDAVRAMLQHLAIGMTEDNLDAERVEKLEDRLYRPEAKEACDRIESRSRWRGRMRQFLTDLSEQTGILGPHDGPDTNWRFWHRTFREALAAERLEIEWRAQDGKAAVLSRVGKITTEEGLSAWAEPFALLTGRLGSPDELVRDLVKENRALGLRSVATAQNLRPETLSAILELSEKWKERSKVYSRIPELVGDPRRALALLDQLRKGTRNGNDLFFLDRAVHEVGRRSCEHVGAAEDLVARLYDHIPRPAEDLFRWIETPKDGRVKLWAEIPKGETWMGSPKGDGHSNETPRHRVTIARPFALAAVAVTNAQFRAFDPGREIESWEGVSDEEFLFNPVAHVTWYGAASFCRWLARSFPWARGARLPLEEEWEHACRAGCETRYWSGDQEDDLARVGWYEKNSGGRTHRVGEKKANSWGLYDIHGNVWEWTLSPWTDSCEGREAGVTIDPSAVDANDFARPPESGERRVMRGGCAWDDADVVRAAYRDGWDPAIVFGVQGFRVVLPAGHPL